MKDKIMDTLVIVGTTIMVLTIVGVTVLSLYVQSSPIVAVMAMIWLIECVILGWMEIEDIYES